jgi:chromate transporter
MSEFFIMVFEFLKTGIFAVGGGLATIPFLREMANKYDWFTVSELSAMIGIAESTPGPVGVNMATYAGFNAFGLLGGIATTLALILPSFIIMVCLAKILLAVSEKPLYKSVMESVRPAAVGLIIAAILGILPLTLMNNDPQGSLFDLPALLLFGGLLLLGATIKKLPPLAFVLIGGVMGIILFK